MQDEEGKYVVQNFYRRRETELSWSEANVDVFTPIPILNWGGIITKNEWCGLSIGVYYLRNPIVTQIQNYVADWLIKYDAGLVLWYIILFAFTHFLLQMWLF